MPRDSRILSFIQRVAAEFAARGSGLALPVTRGELDILKANGDLVIRQPYFITDENRLALPRSTSNCLEFMTEGQIAAAIAAASSQNVAQVRNTNTTANLNTASFTEVPLTGVTDMLDGAFALSGNGIAAQGAGRVKAQASLKLTSTNQRTNLDVVFMRNGTVQPVSGGSGYIRSSSGHNNSSIYTTRWFDLAAGDVISLATKREGGAGTMTMIGGDSVLILETFA